MAVKGVRGMKIPKLFKVLLSTMYRMLVNYETAMRNHKFYSAGAYKRVYEAARDQLDHLVSWEWGAMSGLYSESSGVISDERAAKINAIVRDKIQRMDAEMDGIYVSPNPDLPHYPW